ncbi:MAG: hypothetical protein LWX02_00700 [Deltaproteobacteria bacterium]|nr:hypothetical protein [Deltaproteobacteria bacterium]MDL1986161.1 hypothetical protein [Deltaproteobacteria bacterium]
MNKASQKILFCYIFFLCAHIGLVWFLKYFPTQDGPSHIYNIGILHDLLNGGKEWGNYFTYKLHAVPNLGFNLLAYPMLHFFPPLVAEKLFVSMYIVLMGCSVPLLLHVFNKPSMPLSFFVFPVMFNFTLLMGFYSYVVTIPLFLIAFSLCWKNYNHSRIFKFVFLNITGLIIFYFHLIPFVLFLISLIVITIVRSTDSKERIVELVKLLATISPIILNLIFYLIHSPKNPFPEISYLLSVSRYIRLLSDLFSFSAVNFSPWQMFAASPVMFLYLLFTYSSVKDIYKRNRQNKAVPDSEKFLLFLSSALILIYLFAPFRFGGGSFFNQRFPWVIFLIILPLFKIPEGTFWKRFGSKIIVGAVSFFFVFNAVTLWQQSSKVEKFLSGLHAELPKGAFIMTYKAIKPERPKVDILLHAASYYGIFKKCVNIGNYETGLYYFPVKFKDTIPNFPSESQISYAPETIDWLDYPSIQYLLGWEIDKNNMENLSKFFHIIWEGGHSSIWQRNSIYRLSDK